MVALVALVLELQELAKWRLALQSCGSRRRALGLGAQTRRRALSSVIQDATLGRREYMRMCVGAVCTCDYTSCICNGAAESLPHPTVPRLTSRRRWQVRSEEDLQAVAAKLPLELCLHTPMEENGRPQAARIVPYHCSSKVLRSGQQCLG